MKIYVVTIWDKGECQARNVWYYDNETAARQRIEYEAQKYDGMVKQYNGSYDDNPDDPNNGLLIDYYTTSLRSEFKEEG